MVVSQQKQVMFFKMKGKQGRRGSHQAASRCWGLQDKASRHQQVKRPEVGQQQVDTTAGIDNTWVLELIFPSNITYFLSLPAVGSLVQQNWFFQLPFYSASLPPCRWYILQCLGTAGSPSFAMLSLRQKMLQIHVCGAENSKFHWAWLQVKHL